MRSLVGWLHAAALILALLALPVAIYVAFRSDRPANVIYTVTGNGVASSITYSTSDGQLHESNVALPWQTAVDENSTATITVRANLSLSSFGCRINLARGPLLSSHSSSGARVVVNCSANIGHGSHAPGQRVRLRDSRA
jgi:hypothetical protein